MFIKDIELYNYRSYSKAKAEFAPGVNVIFGQNGQGKTNLLEAVAFLATGKAFRSRKDSLVVRFNCEEASIRGTTCCDDLYALIEARLFSTDKRKQIFINGVKQKTLATLAGKFGTVLFCPEDLNIAREGSSMRRSFLDGAIEQLSPRYSKALREYNKLLEHKTRILRDWNEKPSLLDMIDDFSLRMAQCGSIIISYRAAYMQKLRRIALGLHADISGGKEELQLSYRTVSTVDNPGRPTGELSKLLEEHYFSKKQAEIHSRTCLSGPHKDDIEIEIGGHAVKNFGSQGQVRTSILAMKLAEREMYKLATGTCPVLLLDDVLSELDIGRQDYVLNKIRDGQVLITCCTEAEALSGTEGKMFEVSQGLIYER